MEMQLAAFKKAVRKIKTHAVHESEEWHLDTCYVPKNRLRMVAIENKQAAIKGLPCIGDQEASSITRMVLVLRGINGKRQIEAWEQEELRAAPQKLKLQSLATGWQKAMQKKDDRIAEKCKEKEEAGAYGKGASEEKDNEENSRG